MTKAPQREIKIKNVHFGRLEGCRRPVELPPFRLSRPSRRGREGSGEVEAKERKRRLSLSQSLEEVGMGARPLSLSDGEQARLKRLEAQIHARRSEVEGQTRRLRRILERLREKQEGQTVSRDGDSVMEEGTSEDSVSSSGRRFRRRHSVDGEADGEAGALLREREMSRALEEHGRKMEGRCVEWEVYAMALEEQLGALDEAIRREREYLPEFALAMERVVGKGILGPNTPSRPS